MAQLTAGTGKGFSSDEIEAWFNLLSDVPDASLEVGFARAARECEAFPTVALIRRLAAEAEHGKTSSSADVWKSVLAAVRRFGIYQKAEAREHLGPMVWQAVGGNTGWEHLCDMEADQRTHFAAQVRQRWEQLSSEETKNRALPEEYRPRIDNTPVQGVLEQPKPSRALPSPPQPTPEQIEKAKMMPVFRDPVPAKPVDGEEFERRRAAQIEAAKRLIGRSHATEQAKADDVPSVEVGTGGKS